MARREFSGMVKLAIIKRAMATDGKPRCEQCLGIAVGGEIHHLVQDAMQIDKEGKLTALHGQYLCKPCHKEITRQQAPVLAKAIRREKKALGVKKVPVKPIQSAPFATSEKAAKRQSKPSLKPKQLYKIDPDLLAAG